MKSLWGSLILFAINICLSPLVYADKKFSEHLDRKQDQTECLDVQNTSDTLKMIKNWIKNFDERWIEYAYVSNGKIESDTVVRISVFNKADFFSVEIWFDKFGLSAVRLKEENGVATAEMKLDNKLINISGQKTQKKYLNEVCQIRKKIEEALRRAVTLADEAIMVKTMAGNFMCRQVQLNSGNASVASLFVSEEIPLTYIARAEFLNGDRFETVAIGKNPYTVFSADLNNMSLDSMLDVMDQMNFDSKISSEEKIKTKENK